MGAFTLLPATFSAQVGGWIVLSVIGLPLIALSLVGLHGGVEVYLPWRVDGVWAFVGAAGWAFLVCVVIAALAANGVERRGLPLPAAGWTRVAFGLSGYGALLLGRTPGAQGLVAIVLAPLILRALAYDARGQARRWPLPLGRRARWALMAIAIVVALGYSVPHAFVINGTSFAFTSRSGSDVLGVLRPGQTVEASFGLSGMLFDADILSARPTSQAASRLSIRSVHASLDDLGGGHALPIAVPSRRSVWLTLRVVLRDCHMGAVTLDAVTVRYRTLGITTSKVIVLRPPLRLICRG